MEVIGFFLIGLPFVVLISMGFGYMWASTRHKKVLHERADYFRKRAFKYEREGKNGKAEEYRFMAIAMDSVADSLF